MSVRPQEYKWHRVFSMHTKVFAIFFLIKKTNWKNIQLISSIFQNAFTVSVLQKKDWQGVNSTCRPSRAGCKEIAPFQYLVFSKLLPVKADAAPNEPVLCPSVSISFRFVSHHLCFYGCLCLPASLAKHVLVCLCLPGSVKHEFSLPFKMWHITILHMDLSKYQKDVLQIST